MFYRYRQHFDDAPLPVPHSGHTVYTLRGNIYHYLMMQYFKNREDPNYQDPEDVIAWMHEQTFDGIKEKDYKTGLLWAVNGYRKTFESYGAQIDNWAIHGIECEWSVELEDPDYYYEGPLDDKASYTNYTPRITLTPTSYGRVKWLYTQRADLVYSTPTDDPREPHIIKVLDYKTASTRTTPGDLPMKYQHDGQFLGYCELGKHIYGDDFGGVDVMLVCADAAVGKERIDLLPWIRHATGRDRWLNDIIYWFRRYHECSVTNFWPRTYTERACVAGFGCDYFERCLYGGKVV